MTAPHYHLAQVNIGRIRAPLDDPIMAGFVARLDEINALADSSPGFVWRLQTEDGNAIAVHVYEDDRILLNLSVWESVETLHDYVYRSSHAQPLRERLQWFEKPDQPIVAMWWIPAGQLPTPEEAKQRLDHLRTHGPAEYAFNFKTRFAQPSSPPVLAKSE